MTPTDANRRRPTALPTFPPLPAWDAEFESLAYTAEALFAHPEPDDAVLGKLARRILSILADGEQVDGDGRSLRRDALLAEARVRQADAELDRVLAAVADHCVRADGGAPGSLYATLFPEPHDDIIEMGLDASLPTAMGVTMAVGRQPELAATLAPVVPRLEAAVQLGNRALSERSEAFASLGRHQARVVAWLESAAATRRNTARALHREARGRGLPERFPQTFFLEPLDEILA